MLIHFLGMWKHLGKLRLWSQIYWAAPLLAAAVFAAYANVYTFVYLYDDEFLIRDNKFLKAFSFWPKIIRSCSTAGSGFVDSFYRPLQLSFYLLVQQIFGQDIAAFHALNISLHAFNAFLVYRLGLRLGLRSLFAGLGALLWALHPLHTEAVTYMSATADPLHVLFMLIGLLCFPIEERSLGRQILAAITFVFALLSKEAALVYPALVMSLVFFKSTERWRPKAYLRTLPLWVVAFVYLGLRQTLFNFNGDFTLYKAHNALTESVLKRIYTYAASLPNYLELIFWPHDLHMDRAFPVFEAWLVPDVVLGTVVLLMAVVALLQSFVFRNSRALTETTLWPAWVGLWFFCSQFTQSGIVIPVNSLFLEHWMYLPTIGVALGIARLLQAFAGAKLWRRWLVVTVSLAIALALGSATYAQNEVWESPITLFTNILKYNPNAVRVRHNLAMAYSDLGQQDLALQQYSLILKAGAEYPQTFHNVGRILLSQNKLDAAEVFFKRAIEISPTFTPSYLSLIQLYEQSGKNNQATDYENRLKKVQADVAAKSVH